MKALLQKKYFGLALWIWLLILMAAIIVGMYWRARRAEGDEELEDGEEVMEDEADPADFYDEDFMGPNQGANELLGLNFQLQRLIEGLSRVEENLTLIPKPAKPGGGGRHGGPKRRTPKERRMAVRPRRGLTQKQLKAFRRIKRTPFRKRTAAQKKRFARLRRPPKKKAPTA